VKVFRAKYSEWNKILSKPTFSISIKCYCCI